MSLRLRYFLVLLLMCYFSARTPGAEAVTYGIDPAETQKAIAQRHTQDPPQRNVFVNPRTGSGSSATNTTNLPSPSVPGNNGGRTAPSSSPIVTVAPTMTAPVATSTPSSGTSSEVVTVFHSKVAGLLIVLSLIASIWCDALQNVSHNPFLCKWKRQAESFSLPTNGKCCPWYSTTGLNPGSGTVRHLDLTWLLWRSSLQHDLVLLWRSLLQHDFFHWNRPQNRYLCKIRLR